MMENRIEKAARPLVFRYIATWIAWCISRFIGLGGIGLSVFYGNWNIFSRSGPLIVVCALMLALIDYTSSTIELVDQTKKVLKSKDKQEELEKALQRVREEMEKYGLTKSENEIAYLANRDIESNWEKAPSWLAEIFKMRSVKSEVSLAILGTLIWGFGDLLG